MKLDLIINIRDTKQSVRDFMKEIAEAYGDALTHTFDSDTRFGVSSLMRDTALTDIAMYGHYIEQYDDLVG